MKTFLCSICLVVFAVVNLTVRAEDEPKILWGQPMNEWSLGISIESDVFPQGVPPGVGLLVSNAASIIRMTAGEPRSHRYKIVWSADTGDILEKIYPIPSRMQNGSSVRRQVEPKGTLALLAWCDHILARLPPGQGRLMAIGDVITPNGWQEIYSGELQLRVRPRVESDPPPIALRPSDEELIAAGHARVRAAREAPNSAASNSILGPKSPAVPSTVIKSGTPSTGQKSSTPASPVIATVSAGETPGSVFTPRNIIASIVVLGLLAIIASILVRARSRQNPLP